VVDHLTRRGRLAWRRGAAGQPTPRRNATSGPASTRRSCGQALPWPKCSAPPEAAPNTQICTASLSCTTEAPFAQSGGSCVGFLMPVGVQQAGENSEPGGGDGRAGRWGQVPMVRGTSGRP
jgi:hypothetical protein